MKQVSFPFYSTEDWGPVRSSKLSKELWDLDLSRSDPQTHCFITESLPSSTHKIRCEFDVWQDHFHKRDLREINF